MTPSETKDAYLKHDRNAWLAALVGFLLSLAFLMPPSEVPPLKMLRLSALIGAVSCLFFYVSNTLQKSKLTRLHPDLAREAADERHRLNRLRAQAWGFKVGGAALAAAFFLVGKHPGLLDRLLLWGLLAAAVIPCAAVFLWLERD